jgi:Protein of unknown function (DUF2934)
MESKLEQRIRAKAYQLWVNEGWPSGRALDHWAEAAEAIRAEDAGMAGGRTVEPAHEAAGSDPDENVSDMTGGYSGADPGDAAGIAPEGAARRRRRT